MSNSQGLSYSATLSKGIDTSKSQKIQPAQQQQRKPQRQPQPSESSTTSRDRFPQNHVKRAPSPSHIPKGVNSDEQLYVLTLLTDKSLHNRMTSLRKKYFPKHLNKLAAHLTLFHALPASRLSDSMIPTIQSVTKEFSPFEIVVTNPFRLKRGFGLNISSQQGGQQAKRIHAALQTPWKEEGWLSGQDAGGWRGHYTLMNKVDEERDVEMALEEMKAEWRGDKGVVEGLALWRYERGYWRWGRAFNFQKGAGEEQK